MADIIRHARSYSPWFIPNKGGTASDFHGIFDIGGSGVSISKEDGYVIGKKTKCFTDTDTPESTVPFSQYERGEIATYLALANLASEPVGGLTLTDFSNGLVDVALYGRDEFSGNVELTKYYPKTAIASLGISIDDAEAIIERSIELTGDDVVTLTDDTKYLIHRIDTAPSGTSGAYTITTTTLDPTPIQDPKKLGYILRVDRTRAGETVTLSDPTDYTYNSGTDEIDVVAALSGDIYNVYYHSDSFGSAGDPTTIDPCADPAFIKADSVTILVSDGVNEVEIDCLTSFTLDATLNRIDESCIGEKERALREIEDTPVSIDLSGRVRYAQIEKAFSGSLNTTNGVQFASCFTDDVRITVKIYDDSTKTTFLIGYQVSNLSFSSESLNITANEFATIDFTLESDELFITTTEGNLT